MLLFLAVEVICFPADAQLRRLIKGTGAFETIAIEQLAIGDTVECLKPIDAGDGTVSGFTPGVCDVYYYINAKKVGWLVGCVCWYHLFFETMQG